MSVRVTDRRIFVGVMAMLVVVCWVALAIWSFSPYASYLGHEVLKHVELAVTPEYVLLMLVFVIGWTLMTIAMMLPTSLPLIAIFYRLTSARNNRSQLVALLIAGYLMVWMFFGFLAHLGDLFVHEIVHRTEWLEHNTWAVGAATFAVAGLYQFAHFKYMCLDKCRSPLSFVIEHWRGKHERRHAFQLGIHHGLFCLGCCWSLMLLMFAVGTGNIAWMLLLSAFMAIEKNMTWGRRISAPLGGILLLSSVAMAVTRMLPL